MQLSEKVLRVVQEEHIPADELYQMLGEVALTSIRGCNWRYFDWLFRIEGNVLQDMQRLEPMEIGRGRDRMLEEHDACNGEGCRACGWIGEISRAITDATSEHLELRSAAR